MYVVDFEIMTLNYDTLVGFGPNVEPVPGFAESWTRSADGNTWTFKIRPGHEVVRRPAGDVRGRALDDAVRPQCARRPSKYARRSATSSRTRPRPASLPSLPPTRRRSSSRPTSTTRSCSSRTSRSCPSTSGPSWTHKAASTFQNPLPIVGTGPYQVVEYKPGAIRPAAAQPELLGHAGCRRPDRDHDVQERRHDDPGAQDGRASTTPATSRPTQFDPLKATESPSAASDRRGRCPTRSTSSRSTATPSRSRAAAHRPRRSRTRPSGMRSATPSTSRRIVDKVFNGHAQVGSTHDPARHSRRAGTPSRRTSAPFDIDPAKAKLDAAGYPLDAIGKRLDKEGKQITLRLSCLGATRTEAKAAQLIVDWFGQVGIKVNATASPTRPSSALEMLPPEAIRRARRISTCSSGTGSATRIPTSLLKVLTTKEIGASSDSLWSNSQYDALYDKQLAETNDTAQPRRGRPDAADLVRPGAVPRPVLPEPARRLSDRPVRRVAEPAVQERHCRSSASAPPTTLPDRRRCPGRQPASASASTAPASSEAVVAACHTGARRVRGPGPGQQQQHRLADPADRAGSWSSSPHWPSGS